MPVNANHPFGAKACHFGSISATHVGSSPPKAVSQPVRKRLSPDVKLDAARQALRLLEGELPMLFTRQPLRPIQEIPTREKEEDRKLTSTVPFLLVSACKHIPVPLTQPPSAQILVPELRKMSSNANPDPRDLSSEAFRRDCAVCIYHQLSLKPSRPRTETPAGCPERSPAEKMAFSPGRRGCELLQGRRFAPAELITLSSGGEVDLGHPPVHRPGQDMATDRRIMSAHITPQPTSYVTKDQTNSLLKDLIAPTALYLVRGISTPNPVPPA